MHATRTKPVNSCNQMIFEYKPDWLPVQRLHKYTGNTTVTSATSYNYRITPCSEVATRSDRRRREMTGRQGNLRHQPKNFFIYATFLGMSVFKHDKLSGVR
jgi:hypothetical protein